MSLLAVAYYTLLFGFPRVSGDEPISGAGRVMSDTFSPRERG